MPNIEPKFTLPTGYESEQLKAERKRKIAQALLERGLTVNPNMQSWTQILGQLATAYAGKRLDRRADDIDAGVRDRMTQDYRKQFEDFQNDISLDGDPAAIVKKYGTSPFLTDEVRPYRDAIAAHLKERENIVKFGGQMRRVGDIPTGEREPGSPNDAVIRDANGNWVVNPVRTTAALAAQGLPLDTSGRPGIYSMPDPTGARQPVAPMPGGSSAVGGEDGLDLSLLSPEEKSIIQNELQRRAGGGGVQTQTDTRIPMGSPLSSSKPPAGVANGKPYWIINGIPYDNPEGK